MYFGKSQGINPDTFGAINESAGLTDSELQAIKEAEVSAAQLQGDPSVGFAEQGCIDEAAIFEASLVQDLERMNDEDRKAYMESALFQKMVQEGVVGRNAIVRLSRQADMDRRIHLLCLQMGKENNDADWEALRKNRIKERQLLDKLYKKYGNRVKRQAAVSQKRIAKLNPKAFNLNAPIR